MKKMCITFHLVFILLLPLSLFGQNSPLYLAVDAQDPAKVKVELAKVHDIEERSEAGHTLLMVASGWENLEIVTLLVEKGADVQAHSPMGFGVIHRAAMSKNPEILKYIISKGGKVNLINKSSCSPFHSAISNNALQNYGSLENAKTLLQHGAKSSINKMCRGYTPLMVGVSSEEVTRFLLDNGADKSITTRSGKTAYDLAKEQKAPAAVLQMLALSSTQSKKKTPSNDLVSLTKADKGLMWERKSVSNRHDNLTAEEAQAYCKELGWAGYSGWRVPTLNEYQSVLLESAVTDQTIDGISRYYMDPKVFPNLSPSVFWAKDEKGEMVYLNVAIKRSGKVCSMCNKNLIRCVRGK